MVRKKGPDIKLKPRYEFRTQDDKYVHAYDHKERVVKIMTHGEWEARKGFLMLIVNGEIVP